MPKLQWLLYVIPPTLAELAYLCRNAEHELSVVAKSQPLHLELIRSDGSVYEDVREIALSAIQQADSLYWMYLEFPAAEP
jgi:hypothetical protein